VQFKNSEFSRIKIMPRPRKPTHLKLLTGTYQKCRDPASVEHPLVPGPPDPPHWLPNAHAIKEWNRLAPILHACGLLTEAGTSALAMLCALHGKIVQLFAAGETPRSSLIAQYRYMLGDWGLTPVTASKIFPPGGGTAENPFSKHGKRPD
jgi:hypothetical protein